MKNSRLVHLGLTTLLVASATAGCGKKKSSSPATTTTATGTGSGTASGDTSSTSLLNAYPAQLALAIFTSDAGSSLRLEEDTDAQAKEAAARPIKERAEEEAKIIKGDADSCFSEALEREAPGDGAETCYEFDQDMTYGARGTTIGTYMGTKNGKNSSGEACLVAFAKDRIGSVNDVVEKAKSLVAAMMCQAKKANADVELPAAVGDVLDLKTILGEGFGKKADKIETAKIERLEDNGTLPVYRSVVKATLGGTTRTVVMVHSPGEDDTYTGSLYTIADAAPAAKLALLPPADTKKHVLSINYAKVLQDDGTYRISAELRRARVHDDLIATIIDSTGQLDFNVSRDFAGSSSGPNYGKRKKADGSYYNTNDDMGGQTRILFEQNPDTDEGTFSYWQNPGSNYSEAARGMVANITVDGGVKKGCAISGAALNKDNLGQSFSIAKGLKDGTELQPVGFYHPMYNVPSGGGGGGGQSCTMTSNPGNDADGKFYAATCGTELRKWYEPSIADATLATKFVTEQVAGVVTRQCYTLDETSGMYLIDTAEITETAGFQLVRNTETAKLIPPPALDGKVKPFEGNVVKE